MTQIVDVFIASPGDVKTERGHAEEVVRLVGQRTRELLDVVLLPVSWPAFCPCATRSELERVQDRFTSQVRKCGIFIGILYRRYGTEIDENRRVSGTEEEFNEAIKRRAAIEILAYFRSPSGTQRTQTDESDELPRLRRLQDRLRGKGILPCEYRKPGEFREHLTLDLFEAAIRIRTEAKRREQLRTFFRFGVSKRSESPSALIVYPPIHQHITPTTSEGTPSSSGPKRRRLNYNWRERLLPNVIYEDVKCIQKIEAAVRMTGLQDISSVTVNHPRIGLTPGNRIWLCLPRSEVAARRLHCVRERAWFRFQKKPREDRPRILWKPLGNAHAIDVVSPMARYLQAQDRPKRSPWSPKLGAIVARDYAVIARFPLPDLPGQTIGEHYHHYFVAGIRGLGTWGAGWFIYYRPDELQRLTRRADEARVDTQILLEVTYSNFGICRVEDVSGKPQSYFKNQCRKPLIREVIREFYLSAGGLPGGNSPEESG